MREVIKRQGDTKIHSELRIEQLLRETAQLTDETHATDAVERCTEI